MYWYQSGAPATHYRPPGPGTNHALALRFPYRPPNNFTYRSGAPATHFRPSGSSTNHSLSPRFPYRSPNNFTNRPRSDAGSSRRTAGHPYSRTWAARPSLTRPSPSPSPRTSSVTTPGSSRESTASSKTDRTRMLHLTNVRRFVVGRAINDYFVNRT